MLPMLDEEEPALGAVADELELLPLSRLLDEDEPEPLLLLLPACAKTGVTSAETAKALIRVSFFVMEFFIAAPALPHSCQATPAFLTH
jgi:hypothetical protein